MPKRFGGIAPATEEFHPPEPRGRAAEEGQDDTRSQVLPWGTHPCPCTWALELPPRRGAPAPSLSSRYPSPTGPEEVSNPPRISHRFWGEIASFPVFYPPGETEARSGAPGNSPGLCPPSSSRPAGLPGPSVSPRRAHRCPVGRVGLPVPGDTGEGRYGRCPGEGGALAPRDEKLRPATGPGVRSTKRAGTERPRTGKAGKNRGEPRGPGWRGPSRQRYTGGQQIPAGPYLLPASGKRGAGTGALGGTGWNRARRGRAGPVRFPRRLSRSPEPVPGARRVRASRPRLLPSPERGWARRGRGRGLWAGTANGSAGLATKPPMGARGALGGGSGAAPRAAGARAGPVSAERARRGRARGRPRVRTEPPV